MKTLPVVSLGLSVLLLGGALAGGVQGVAYAGGHTQSREARKASKEADWARGLLAHGKGSAAVSHAERAVRYAPEAVDFRMLLGQSYLKAGRFTSARDAFRDVLSLDAGNGKAALNFALAQIATGDWGAARKTLDANAAIIPANDLGLAIALAGDPATAVNLLAAAARLPEATAKTRQNLALSLALAGRWQDARSVAATDLAPAEVDKRIVAWGAFARPKTAADQVASLIGVKPVADRGQPAALALNAATNPMAQASVAPVATPAQEVAAAAPVVAPTPVAAIEEVPARNASVQPVPQQAVALPTPAPKKPAIVKVAAVKAPAEAAPRPLASGSFFVQLGAYENAGVAKDAWNGATRRFAAFSGHTPQGASIRTAGGSFYRLSVGGYARADAVKLCLSYRTTGGRCFVRAGTGDQVATWVKPGQQIASR